MRLSHLLRCTLTEHLHVPPRGWAWAFDPSHQPASFFPATPTLGPELGNTCWCSLSFSTLSCCPAPGPRADVYLQPLLEHRPPTTAGTEPVKWAVSAGGAPIAGRTPSGLPWRKAHTQVRGKSQNADLFLPPQAPGPLTGKKSEFLGEGGRAQSHSEGGAGLPPFSGSRASQQQGGSSWGTGAQRAGRCGDSEHRDSA